MRVDVRIGIKLECRKMWKRCGGVSILSDVSVRTNDKLLCQSCRTVVNSAASGVIMYQGRF